MWNCIDSYFACCFVSVFVVFAIWYLPFELLFFVQNHSKTYGTASTLYLSNFDNDSKNVFSVSVI